jgi:predicted enzyme related to lactoylglutathione lyase
MITGGNINDTTMMTAVLEDIRVPRAGKGRPRTAPRPLRQAPLQLPRRRQPRRHRDLDQIRLCQHGLASLGMTCTLVALGVAARNSRELARFWSALLGWTLDESSSGVGLLPTDDTGFVLRFVPSGEPKVGQNRMHLDLTSASPDDQQRTVARALELGGRHLDIGQGDVPWVVMADPEGNEFCVIEAGNRFLAECGFVGALACDGSQEVGYFWRDALGWPLVWDQDQETAIRSPYGGPKITWGGPPLPPKPGRNRLHFEVAAEGDLDPEVERLVSLGATRIVTWRDRVEMADPDCNEFFLVPGSAAALG